MRALAMLLANPLQTDSRVLIESDVVDALHAYRQFSVDESESGGILLGYRRLPHMHVVEFTTPAARDRQSRYEFERCDPYHAEHAHARWKVSRGMLDCLGDWHSHPEEDPRPSGLDRSEWRRVLSSVDHMRVFLIVGLRRDWVGVGRGRRLRQARQVTAGRIP
jgi:integrative and conjugative element protein (TIGR02256 family)